MCIVTTIASEWNQPMFLLRPQFTFAVHRFESEREVAPRFRGLNNLVHETPSRGDIRIGEGLAILLDQLLAARGLIVRCFNFMAEDNFRSAFSAHHRDFRRGPCNHAVGAETL